MSTKPLGKAPQDLDSILEQEAGLVLPRFTADDAFAIGTALRERLRGLSSAPAVVNISLANSDNLLFHAVSRSGVLPDNDSWVARKRKTVMRWGMSTWAMHHKMKGDENAFRNKYMLGDGAGLYAIHGGGVPVRVRNVEGIVAVIVVSGLKQDQDHQIVVEALQEFIAAAETPIVSQSTRSQRDLI